MRHPSPLHDQFFLSGFLPQICGFINIVPTKRRPTIAQHECLCAVRECWRCCPCEVGHQMLACGYYRNGCVLLKHRCLRQRRPIAHARTTSLGRGLASSQRLRKSVVFRDVRNSHAFIRRVRIVATCALVPHCVTPHGRNKSRAPGHNIWSSRDTLHRPTSLDHAASTLLVNADRIHSRSNVCLRFAALATECPSRAD